MSFRVVAFAAAVFSACLHGRGDATARVGPERRDPVREDRKTSASGYIYRTDGENPPVFIKLGEGENEQFDVILNSE